MHWGKYRKLTHTSKLADWDDDDPQSIQDTSSRWDKVVILKHMFTLEELEVCLRTVLKTAIKYICRRTQLPFWISKKISAMSA